MTLDEFAEVVGCALGVDGGCPMCERYVLDRLCAVFLDFAWRYIEAPIGRDEVEIVQESTSTARTVRPLIEGEDYDH